MGSGRRIVTTPPPSLFGDPRQARVFLHDKLIIDNFAGGGGASTGIEQALGRAIDVAINHDAEAIALHEANHPTTRHYNESVWNIDPRAVTEGRPVALVWLSPDCTHFSNSRGGVPVKKSIRGLAWIGTRWAATVKPDVLMLENVAEFTSWGPLIQKTGEGGAPLFDEDGQPQMIPDPKRKGQTFKSFVRALERLGYVVDWRELRACDYGAPTSRERLFLVARRDGLPIIWPEPTHGDPDSDAVRAGQLRPWRTAGECIDWNVAGQSIFGRDKPLAEKTMTRLAKGLHRFVLSSDAPFIVPGRSCAANITTFQQNIIGQHPNTPLGTVMAGATRFGAVHTELSSLGGPLDAAFLQKYYGTGTGQTITEPLHTIGSRDTFAAITLPLEHAYVVRQFGTATGSRADRPLGTVMAGGGGGKSGVAVSTAETITEHDAHDTLTRARRVYALLREHHPEALNHPDVDHDRQIVTVTIGNDTRVVTDVTLRMLNPRELYNAQGFPPDYKIDVRFGGGKLSLAAQIRMCGNSVVPAMARALVEANLVLPSETARKAG